MSRITFILPSLTSGGSERVFSTLAGWLDAHGHQVSIITMKDDTIVYQVPDSVRLIHLRIRHGNFLKKLIASFSGLNKAIKSLDPQVIIDSNYYRYSVLVAKHLKRPIILSYRNDPGQSHNRIRILYRDIMYSQAAYSFFQTEDIRSYFIKSTHGKCCVIHNPLFPGIPEPFEGERRKTFVSICRLNAQKNIPMTLQAFAAFLSSHPGYTLEIYGTGPQEKALKELCETLNISESVIWGGFASDVLRRAQDCTAFLSSSNYEGLSNAMLESMAMGLPVIVTDSGGGGAREFVHNGQNGILIRCADTKAMADAMCKIADDTSLAKELGRNAALIRSELSVDKIGTQLEELIAKVLE